MEFRETNDTVINKLRVKGEAPDYVSWRLNSERLLSSESLAPVGLPRRAIFCVKRVVDPKPRNLRLNYSDIRASQDWRNAVVREVENQYRRSFRPFNESVPANAEGVVFNDRAELLACLAIDFCRGKIFENWWWRAIFPQLEKARNVAGIWLESIEYAPPAFQFLVEKGEVVNFIQKLNESEIVLILQKIIESYCLFEIAKVLMSPPANSRAISEPVKAKTIEKILINFISHPSKLIETQKIVKAALRDVNGELLTFDALVLLETVLTLVSSPKTVRSKEFSEFVRLQRLLKDYGKDFVGEKLDKIFVRKNATDDISPRNILPLKKSRKSDSKSKTAEFFTEKLLENSEIKINSAAYKTEENAKIRRLSERISDLRKSPKIKFEMFDEREDKLEQKGEKQTDETKQNKNSDFSEAADFVEKKNFNQFFDTGKAEIEISFETKFGGVFYLLNLGLYLELYNDFTANLVEEIKLNIWDFVALLSLKFLGDEIKSDPVWEFLKSSAQRESDNEFGKDFDDSQDWRVPLTWLKDFAFDQKWFYTKKSRRLMVRHPAGFNVIDVLINNNFQEQFERELNFYQRFFRVVEKDEQNNLKPVRPKKWLDNLTEYLEKRLYLALNLRTKKEINELLFRSKATIVLTATHLEITFSLADLPLEIRLAGIDRDPGWIPAAGRFVYFHFV